MDAAEAPVRQSRARDTLPSEPDFQITARPCAADISSRKAPDGEEATSHAEAGRGLPSDARRRGNSRIYFFIIYRGEHYCFTPAYRRYRAARSRRRLTTVASPTAVTMHATPPK